MSKEPSPYRDTHEALSALGGLDGTGSIRADTIHSQHTFVEAMPASTRSLPPLALNDEDGSKTNGPYGFELTHTIGEGGMGQVYAAHQPVLRREVAVKRVRQGTRSKNAAGALIHEARLLAHLEHPNIPPVHTLGADDKGQPVLVMKRVRGVTWSDITNNPDHTWWKRVTGDKLTWHLRVLIQVCNVLAYAHSRHVLHRDIKLDNVMIGSFGETYVLDWGAAVSLDDGGEYWSRSFSGTPANAAPEMVRTEDPLTAATDVYLLGALLHEILTGKSRHQSRSLKGMLRSAAFSKPVKYPASIPAPLADLCNRAMHRDPAKRPACPSGFRDAIEDFLDQRVANKLLSQADALLNRLAEMRSSFVSLSEQERLSEQHITHDEFHNLGIRCRFAYEQALNAAPDFSHAYQGLAECVLLQAYQAADIQNYQAARNLLSELKKIPKISRHKANKLKAYITEQERTHKERRDELTTQVQYALIERVQVAEAKVRKLQAQLTGDSDDVTRRMKAKKIKK